VPIDAFAVLAEPARRRILERLRLRECNVGELAGELALSQPSVSKHLRVLRDSGFVSCRTVAQHRVYRVEVDQFRALDEWLAPYRQLWAKHLGALERHLDSQE
jgi:DNA-binding transcriptional ArsR family regulator